MIIRIKPLTHRQQVILARWNEGTSPGTIANEVGASRPTVVGEIHRIRRLRKSDGSSMYYVRAGETNHDGVPKPKYERKAKPLPAPPKAGASTLIDRQANMRSPAQRDIHWDDAIKIAAAPCCKWPGWSEKESKGTICGAEVLTLNAGTKKQSQSPYCEFHHGKAYPAYASAKAK